MTAPEGILIEQPLISRIGSRAGLHVSIFDGGIIQSIIAGKVRINLFTNNRFENACGIYLRKRENPQRFTPLFGPGSGGRYSITENQFLAGGDFEDIRFLCRLSLAPNTPAWKWTVHLENTGRHEVPLDLIYTQDVGMTAADEIEKNEFYISQYIDYTILRHAEHGPVVCCRQNELGPGCLPWLALGSLEKAADFSTDGQLFYGPQYRAAGVPDGLLRDSLQGLLQKETALIAVRQQPFVLPAGQSRKVGFFGIFCTDHPEPTEQKDLDLIESGIEALQTACDDHDEEMTTPVETAENLFTAAPLFRADDLSETDLEHLFEGPRRHCEYQNGRLLSFFRQETDHVVLKAKEGMTDRPCGHILKTGGGFDLEESILGCTSFMFGVFQSHLTQGNVNFNRFLSIHTDPFNLVRHTGQRMFIERQGRYEQLAVPSAFEMSPNHGRWIYKKADLLFEVTVTASPDSPQTTLRLAMLRGPACRWIVTHHLAEENGWHLKEDRTSGDSRTLQFTPDEKSRPGKKYKSGSFEVGIKKASAVDDLGGDENVFTDGRSRSLPFLTVRLNPCKSASITIRGRLIPHHANQTKKQNLSITADPLPRSASESGLSELIEILPWFTHNAQIHYLLPHGLEQYGGAAWGTRDICQGPIEMLLAIGRFDVVRDILCRVFSHQNPNGNWPQWWMFDRYHTIRAPESHGDVVFWPILAACDYMDSSGDRAFLDERLPFYAENRAQTVLEHLLRAFHFVQSKRRAAATSLVDYSDGDWNDALQPISPSLKKKLISSWTVELSYQAAEAFARLCSDAGLADHAQTMHHWSRSIREDFQHYLISDSVVSGFGIMRDDNTIDRLMHPSSQQLEARYRLLPMTRGILSGLFSPEQANHHLELIERYLAAPDGVRLMDRPMTYRGGQQRYFKRAENSPFFGREIGLMYTHAHLRYAEALALLGQADRFLEALRKAVPVNLQAVVPTANPRQSNCYFSSSDAAFSTRYEVNERYTDLFRGTVPFNGGWRIYSSGPGIFVKLVLSHLFGIRRRADKIEIDPVLPRRLNGLSLTTDRLGTTARIRYFVSGKNKGLRRIEINGRPVSFSRSANPYRLGGAVISDRLLTENENKSIPEIKVYL